MKDLNKETLRLNKNSIGCYSKRIDNIEISVNNCFISMGIGSNEWEGTIKDWSKSDEDFITFHVFGKTKKEVYKMMVDELTK